MESKSGFNNHIDLSGFIKKRNTIEKFTELHVSTQTAIFIAHAVHQPLTALSFYNFVLKKLLETENPDLKKIKDIADKCYRQSQRTTEVFNHLKIFLNNEELISVESDINVLIYNAVNYLKVTEDLSTIRIKLNLSKNLPNIHVNPLHIEKAIIALIINALESLKDNNKPLITIETSLSCPKATMIQVSLLDNGKGVPDLADLNLIFQPFYSTKTNNIGMGLPISKTLIESYGGKIWAEQNAQKGLSVKFTLPS